MTIAIKKCLTHRKENIMDNISPNEKITKIEKKVYITPEMVEHGILSEVTNGEGNCEPYDPSFEGGSPTCG